MKKFSMDCISLGILVIGIIFSSCQKDSSLIFTNSSDGKISIRNEDGLCAFYMSYDIESLTTTRIKEEAQQEHLNIFDKESRML